MALPIRDGNQSLTTLSTILVSSSHIPAHTVISFGTQGITDIATAVSGVELGPNTLNALENITVTLGQVTITGGLTDAELRASVVTIGGGIYLSDAQVVIGGSAPPEAIQIGGYNLADNKLYPIHVDDLGVQTIKGAVTASISGTASVTFGTAVITGSTSILNFPATQPISISSVTIGSLPAISGTVTANLSISSTAITSGSFSSLTSATLVPANTDRKMATVYNLGAGQLFVNAGATATTLGGGFMVALSAGDFYECNYTTTTLSALFATAGTASWVSH